MLIIILFNVTMQKSVTNVKTIIMLIAIYVM